MTDWPGTTPRRFELNEGRSGMAEAVEAYCVKCREKREVKDPKEVTMKNGRHAIEGTCPVCGTRLFRMISDKAAKKS
jgi:hypothetical protein